MSAAGSGSLARLLGFLFFFWSFPSPELFEEAPFVLFFFCEGLVFVGEDDSGRGDRDAASAADASDLINFPGVFVFFFLAKPDYPRGVHNWSIGILKIFVLPRCFFSEPHSQQEDAANPSASQIKWVLLDAPAATPPPLSQTLRGGNSQFTYTPADSEAQSFY